MIRMTSGVTSGACSYDGGHRNHSSEEEITDAYRQS